MVKHMIIWNFKQEMSQEEKKESAAKIKAGLEGLKGVVPGLLEIRVQTEFLDSSNGDIMLDSTLESVEALKAYQVNPDHLKVAQFVRSVVESRKCVDYQL